MGGGFFFGLWWGFLIVFAGNVVATAISFALSRFVARRWFRRKLSRNAYVEGARSCGGTRELEDYSPEPVASAFSHQPAELLLWADANSVWHLHALGLDWSYAWPFLLRIHRNAGATSQCASCAAKVTREWSSIGFGVAHS